MTNKKVLPPKEFQIKKAQENDAPKILEYINKIAGETDNLTFGSGEFGITLKQEREIIKNYSKTNFL